MKRIRQTCGTCAGKGYEYIWTQTAKNEETGICTMESEKKICSLCDGNGYTEYAVFSIEEAEAILKHCGLDKE